MVILFMNDYIFCQFRLADILMTLHNSYVTHCCKESWPIINMYIVSCSNAIKVLAQKNWPISVFFYLHNSYF